MNNIDERELKAQKLIDLANQGLDDLEYGNEVSESQVNEVLSTMRELHSLSVKGDRNMQR